MTMLCPHCQQTIPFEEEAPPLELQCNSCGTAFEQASGDTVTVVRAENNDTVTYLQKPQSETAATAPPHASRQFGDYELLEEIARGGMGVVFKARQKSLNRVVALKMIKSGELADAEEVHRFHAEAEAAAHLDHPNIVPVYEVGEANGQHFFSMGLVEGESLSDRLKEGPLPPRDAAELIKNIAEAAQYAHEKEIVHRDLKPSNILIDSEGKPRVTDFGLAKRTDVDSSMTASGQVLGTPSYMPPEQAAGRTDKVGPHSDVYALGAILYCLLTGKPPFQAAHVVETIRQVLNEEPLSPRQLNPNIDRDLETICLKALHKEPQERYASARDMSQDLDRFLAGIPIHARPVGRVEKLTRWCRRNPLTSMLIAGVVVALLAGTGISTVFAVLAEDRRVKFERQAKIAGENAEEMRKQRDRADNESKRYLAEKQTSEKRLYGSNMLLLSTSYRENNLVRMLNLLERHAPRNQESGEQPDLRKIEWYFWANLLRSDLSTFPRKAPVKTARFSPDGTRITLFDSQLQTIDADTGEQIVKFDVPKDFGANGLAFNHDGTKLVVRGNMPRDRKSTVIVFNAMTGKQISAITGVKNELLFAAYDSKGHRIAYSTKTDIVIKSLATGKTEKRIPAAGDAARLGFAADGDLLAVWAYKRGLEIWSTKTAERVATLIDAQKEAQKTSFRRSLAVRYQVLLSFAPYGKYIAVVETPESSVFGLPTSAMPAPTTVQLWEADSAFFKWGEYRNVPYPVRSVATSADERLIAFASGLTRQPGIVSVYDRESNELRYQIRGHLNVLTALEFNGDNRRILTASEDNTVKLWDVQSGQRARRIDRDEDFDPEFGPNGGKLSAISPSDHWLLTYGENSGRDPKSDSGGKFIRIRSLTSGKVIANLNGFSGEVQQFAIDQRGRWLIVSHENDNPDAPSLLSVWNWSKVKAAIESAGKKRTPAQVPTISLASIGSHFAQSYPRDLDSITLSPDGSKLAIRLRPDFRNRDGHSYVTVLDVEAGRVLQKIDVGEYIPRLQSFSPDGNQLAMFDGIDYTLQIWDVRTGQQVATGKDRHRGKVTSAVFSPDGTLVASASRDRTVRIWRTRDGSMMYSLHGHTNDVSDVVFQGNSRLLSLSADSMKIWDVEAGQEVLSLITNRRFDVFGLIRNSNWIVAADDQEILTWSVGPLPETKSQLSGGSQPPPAAGGFF